MHYRFVSVIAVTINLMLHSSPSRASNQRGYKNGNVFNVLLGLYKVNPLRRSQIYRSFSEGVLSGHPERTKVEDMKFESNENKKKKLKSNLNEIEKVIHVKHRKPRKKMGKPEYNIEDVDIENFTVDIMINDTSSKEKIEVNPENDNFSGLFAHIGSDEIDDDLPVTKLLPINDTIQNIPRISENFKLHKDLSIEFGSDKTKGIDKISPYVDVPNEIQGRIVMTDKFDTADVIVI
ncbi:uncharacterized protein LOC113498584 [Trichoplusia ni]|uniref:Uncharacterized protein LOC113498584 n=1 Tax=Trichoplusia ni TaxID=7111 RepID=A0A7E5W1R2_TRINI|nr:uncharacterized protein LOC113498584 [Trichoplusia ni]